ncbi:MAG: PilW family protein [Thiohalomonas sp.]|nr:PilW family protein [Thiohalomonas sp.]
MIQANKKKQFGLTLIELMVAVTIGMIVMAGVMQIYLSNKQTYRTTEALSRLQENGRFSSHFLLKDIRMSGYQGCKSRVTAATKISDPGPASNLFDINGAVSGVDNSDGNEDMDGDGTDDTAVLAGTDVIHIQFGGSCDAMLTGNMSPNNANIKITWPNSCGLDAGDFFMITDCEAADIAKVTNNPNQSGTSQTLTHGGSVNIIPPKLSKLYSAGAKIFSLKSVSYYVALNANNIPALMRRNNATGATEELVESVDYLQFDYGEDTDGSGVANYYVSAGSIVNMEDIVSVRMTVRVRTSDDNISQSAKTVTYNGGNVTDKRIRHTFSSTIAIRNR